MSPQEQVKLRTRIRELVKERVSRGEKYSSADLVDEVMRSFPDLVENAKDMLFREAVGKWSRAYIKSEAEAFKSAQFELPTQISHLKLPASISLPPAPIMEGEEGQSGSEVMWSPIETATFAELEAHIRLLQNNVSAAYSSLSQLRALYQFLRPHMENGHRSDPIGPMLAALAAKEKAKRLRRKSA